MAETLQHLINRLQEEGRQIQKIYFIEAGTYQLNKRLVINEPNVALVGIGDVTLVKAKSADGVYVEEGGFCMMNIKVIDEGENDTGGSCLVVKASNTLIEHCYFNRRAKNFSVYYPGPDINTKNEAIENFYNLEKAFHTGNVFQDNIVRSNENFSHDNLAFCFQNGGRVVNNQIEGKFAFYLCNGYSVARGNYIVNRFNENLIQDSIALFISLPTENITVQENRIISVYGQYPVRIKIQTDNEYNPEVLIIKNGEEISIQEAINTFTRITLNNNSTVENQQIEDIHVDIVGNLGEDCVNIQNENDVNIQNNEENMEFTPRYADFDLPDLTPLNDDELGAILVDREQIRVYRRAQQN